MDQLFHAIQSEGVKVPHKFVGKEFGAGGQTGEVPEGEKADLAHPVTPGAGVVEGGRAPVLVARQEPIGRRVRLGNALQ